MYLNSLLPRTLFSLNTGPNCPLGPPVCCWSHLRLRSPAGPSSNHRPSSSQPRPHDSNTGCLSAPGRISGLLLLESAEKQGGRGGGGGAGVIGSRGSARTPAATLHRLRPCCACLGTDDRDLSGAGIQPPPRTFPSCRRPLTHEHFSHKSLLREEGGGWNHPGRFPSAPHR